MAHTPGPWQALPPDETTTRGMISQVPPGSHIAPFYIGSVYTALQAPAEANARLIAAAPDLLAACKKALSYISADMPTSDIQFAAMDDVEDALRAAIARVEGG